MPYLVATDDFNRADNADLGAVWTPYDASFKIVSSSAKPNSQAADAGERYDGGTFDGDQWAEVRVFATGGSSGSDVGGGISLRHDGGGNYYRIVASIAGTNAVHLSAFTSGSGYTDLGVFADTDFVTGDYLRAEIKGNVIRVYRNNVYLGQLFNALVPSGGRPGIAYSSTITDVGLTNFAAGSLLDPYYISSSQNLTGPGASDVGVVTPPGLNSGDTIFFALIMDSAQIGTVSPLGGITQVGSWVIGEPDSYNTPALGIFKITYDGIVATYNFNLTGGGTRGVNVSAHGIRGTATVQGQVTGTNTASASARSSPVLNGTTGNLVMAFAGGSAVNETFATWTGGFLERFEFEYYGINAFALADSGSSVQATVTPSGSTQTYWQLLEIGPNSAPAAPAGDAGPTLIKLIGNRQRW